MKKIFYQLSALLLIILVAGLGNLNAQTYTCQGHQYGCTSNTNNRYYAAINGVELLTGGATVYKKAGDNCNDPSAVGNGTGHYNVMSTKPMFTMVAGSKYELKFDITNPGGYNGYQNFFMVYLDLDGDGKFTTTGEHISANWNTFSSATTHTVTFTLPCNGVVSGASRLRLRSDYQYGNLNNAVGDHTRSGYFGETEEYPIILSSPTSITSTFNMVDTMYVGTAATATYTGNGGSVWWDWENNGSIDQTGGGVFNGIISSTVGCFDLECIAENCFGKDSSVKKICVVNPTQGTISDFVADRTDIELYEEISFFDLSQYGPTDWRWHIFDTNQSPQIHMYTADRTSGSAKNPNFEFNDEGKYTVCLSTYNIFGWSADKCKTKYINVRPYSQYDVSSVWPTITTTKGVFYDKGGPDFDYERNASKFTNFLTVIPCDAGAIDITFTQFKMADGSDKVFIFDGTDVNAPPLHPSGGFTNAVYNSMVPFKVTAKSGAFFVYYESNGSGEDSGFVATWEAEEGNGLKPVAGFTTQYDKAYNSVETEFTNTSTNVKGVVNYKWLIDGMVYTTKDAKHTFYTDGTYPICLIATSCLGADTTCKNIDVVTPQDKANIDFTASNQRPVLGELITMDLINDKANTFEWEIFPSTYVFANGTDKYSAEPEFTLSKPGCYTVTLTASNSTNPTPTKKTIVKDFYICVVGYCTPSADISTQDVSISNVKLMDGTTALINNSSGTSSPTGYTDYSEDVAADVLFGKEYSITMSRTTNIDEWNGKIWVDWNIDGDFDDANEEILTEGSSTGNSFTKTFRVPNFVDAFEGKSKMRVACGYKSKAPTPCANMKIGEYEDYTINITRDNDLPVISLVEPLVYVMQVNTSGVKKYVEPGYLAIDPSEGDISSKVVVDDSEVEEDAVGYYSITYNVCDESGNCAIERTRTVKVVKDITAPIITLASPVVNVPVSEKRACLGTLNTYSFDYSTIGATANDPEDGSLTHLLNYDANAVDNSNIGTYTVMFTVNDIQGNADTAYATVNVQDLTAPDIVKDGPEQLPIGETWTDQTWACDKYDEFPVLVVEPGAKGMPNPYIKGEYPVTYKAYDASGNNAIAVVRNYKVDDFVPPVIDLHTADTIYHEVNTKYYSVNASAKDKITKDINVTKTGYVDWHKVGVYQEEYKASDASNNQAVKIRFVHVVDTKAPQITANALCVKMGIEFWNRTGLVIIDNYDNPIDLLEKVEIVTSNVNVHVPGTYSISYKVEDASGNQSSIFTRVVTVSEKCEEVGINDIALADKIKVYPVPSKGEITIDVNVEGTTLTADVVNLLGEKVADLGELTTGTNTVNVRLDSKGVYFIRFTDGSKSAIKKIIIN